MNSVNTKVNSCWQIPSGALTSAIDGRRVLSGAIAMFCITTESHERKAISTCEYVAR